MRSPLPWRSSSVPLLLLLLLALITIGQAQETPEESPSQLSQPDNEDACTPLRKAETLLQSLQPPANSHLEKKIGGSGGPFGGSWGEGLGWGHEGPISTTLRLLPRLLNTLLYPRNLISYLTSTNPNPNTGASGGGSGGGGGRVSKARKRGIEMMFGLLDEAEEKGCLGVWKVRGGIYMFPPKGLNQDLPAAFNAYTKSLENSSDPESQFMLAFFHATGLGGITPDQGKAVLYYTFAALQGHRGAEMALGYRHWAGIGVKESCLAAMDYYESAAEKAYAHFLSGPPGGHTLPLTSTRLSDREGGIYGSHASWASTSSNARRAVIKASSAVARGETEREILEYYQYHSDRDSYVYTVRLGGLFYHGSVYSIGGGVASGAEGVGEIPQSYSKAKEYFMKVARALWPIDFEANGQVAGKRKMSKEQENDIREPAMVAAAFLGRMLLRGEGGKPDYRKARMWFERAAELGDREALNGLGIMYRDGISVPANKAKAFDYFQAAAGQDLAEAQVNLAKLHLERGELTQAISFLEVALRHGSPFEAFHLLSSIHATSGRLPSAQGGRPGMCGVSVAWFKLASERGSWLDNYMLEADKAWARGEEDKALLGWWIAAEMGSEGGLNNVAWLIDQGGGRNLLGDIPEKDREERARDVELTYWMRSAAQDNVDAMVKVGDLYYSGQGISLNPPDNNYEKAVSYYQAAADTQSSALAYWNLGYMYEHGKGVKRDWHLAKRYYDLCSEVGGEGWLGIGMSLVGLYLRSWWVDFRTQGATPGLSLFDEDDTRPSNRATGGSLWDRITSLFEPPPMTDEEIENVLQQHERQQAEDFGGNGWITEDGDGDEDLADTVMIIGLGMLVMGLFWIRGRWGQWAEERRVRIEREGEQRRLMGEAGPVGVTARGGVGDEAGGDGGARSIDREGNQLPSERERERQGELPPPTYIS